nr:uroporphyrinogen decarboxylase family protein [Geminisphaera colitermitum]
MRCWHGERELLDEARLHGIPYLLHICGNTRLILDKMATLGLDAVELDYATPLDEIVTHFGSRTTLFGTIDPSGIFNFGTPDKVRAEAEKIFTAYRDNPRLVIGAGCALPPTTPAENIHAIVNFAHSGVF